MYSGRAKFVCPTCHRTWFRKVHNGQLVDEYVRGTSPCHCADAPRMTLLTNVK